MKKLAVLLLVLAALAAGVALGRRLAAPGPATPAASAARILYRCPMHLQVVSDSPGHCPICHMQFVPYVPGSGENGPAASSGVAGRAALTLDEAAARLVGARAVEVAKTPFVRTIVATGRVAVDDTRMQHIHTKVQGWIEHLHVGAAGDPVVAGQPVLSIYSPELLASQQEYLVALDARARAAGSTLPGVREEAERLVASARQRLLLQDLGPEQIESLERTRTAERLVTLYSPVSGTITARNVSHGERVESATSLLDIADLSRVWVLADLYETDLPFVRDGQEAEIRLAYLPGRTYRERIRLLSPLVDPATRTVKARIEVGNADLALKPGMFAEVTLVSDLGSRVSLPKEAVLRTGTRDLVFVNPDGEHFVPRAVTVGMELPDRWEIVDGVRPGERVLASANFFVDSESKLKAAAGGGRP